MPTDPTVERVEARIELPYRVRFDECGADGALRSSSHLRYAQELAWVHSDMARFDRHWYAEHGLMWLIRCLELEVMAPIGHGEPMRVSTEVVGFRRVWARRRSEFRGVEDERLRAVALTDWVLIGPKGPITVPPEIQGRFDAPVVTFFPARVEAASAPHDARETRLTVRRHELDPLGHVNNAAYLDYLEEAVAGAGGTHDVVAYPRRYRLEYLVSAEAAASLRALAWRVELGWRFELRGIDGPAVLRGVLETDLAGWVGG